MTHRAEVRLKLDSEEDARAIYSSLKPEADSMSGRHYRASLRLEGSEVSLTLEAGSLSKLRAALNSYLRWMYSAIELKSRLIQAHSRDVARP